jgi:cell surface protein SprA
LQLFSIFTKFKDVSINAGRNDSYSQSALRQGRPSWGYQLGFTRDPGVKQLDNVTAPSNFQRRDNISASSGFDVGRSFNITVRFDHDQQRNEIATRTVLNANAPATITSTITGSSSDSWLRTSELGLAFVPEVDIPFPEWTVTWNGLERIKLFSKFASNMSVSHGFGGKKSSLWNGSPERVTSEDFSFNFKPLVKVNTTLKNGMITTFQYSKTTGERPTYIYDQQNVQSEQGASLTRTNEMSFTLSYSKQSGFRLPLPFLKNKELRNSIDLSLTFLRSSSTSGQRRSNLQDIEDNRTKRWSLSPRMTYSFSNRVRGGAHFEIGKNESKQAGKTDIKELGIDINISIRGE